MNDGWDDDLDLEIPVNDNDNTINDDDDDDDLRTNDNEMPTTSTANGWEEDEDLFGDDDDDNVIQNPKADGEGWNDDDVDLNFDDDWGEETNNPASAPLSSQGQQQQQRTPSPFGAPESAYKVPADTTIATDVSAVAGGWGEDDDLFEDDEEDDTIPEQTSLPPAAPPKKKDLLQELKSYVSSLSRMLSSINAVLEYEYNTPEKSQELVQYYSQRPGLAEYTRTKEVPRMNYQVILPDGHVETDKNVIAQEHLPDQSLVSRAANQSLLADLLHVLTGPDLVVRPQFLAVCVAQTCQFRLHVGDQGRDMVQCNCMLQLSLPVADGPRLKIATIRTTIVFSPNQPMVKFRVDKIIVMLKEHHYYRLERVVEFLNMMEGHFDELPGHEDAALQNAPAGIFRDVFLEQSQQLVTQSTAGMKSALNEMESVIGLKSKFKAVSGGISRFLPDTNVLLQAEEEANTFAEQQGQQKQRQPPPPPYARGRPTVQRPVPLPPHQQQEQYQQHIQNRPPPPPQPRPPAPPSGEAARPKSILGGLVSSGWSALAKSVTIPDEDPAIYGPAHPSLVPQQKQQQQPMLHRKPEPTPSKPTELYHPEPILAATRHVQPPEPKEEPLKLYRNESPRAFTAASSTASRQPSHARPPTKMQRQDAGTKSSPVAPPPPPNKKMEDKKIIAATKPPPGEAPISSEPALQEILEPEHDMNFGDGWDDDLDLEAEIDDGKDKKNIVEEEDLSKGATSAEEAIEQEDEDELEEQTVISPTTHAAPPPIEVSSPRMDKPKPLNRAAEATPDEQLDNRWEPSPAARRRIPPRRSLVADIPYDPQDDIIPTRKRWVNPRPDRPYLTQ